MSNWESSDAKLTPYENEKSSEKPNLMAFTRATMPTYRPHWHNEALAEMLDRVAAGNCRRLMVFMPPQHGKSELVSRRFPAFLLGKKPNLRLIAASHTIDWPSP